MRKLLLILFICLFTSGAVLAQNGRVVTGKLLDAQTKEPLIGASVIIKGTTNGTTTSLDGTFKIRVPEGSQVLVLSYVSYLTQEVTVESGSQNVGEISLKTNDGAMKEVTIIGDKAIDRKTPIAVSTIGQVTIEEKGAGLEFPELLTSTPGVMATKTGGGYGDSRISIRGFQNNNVAMLLNGMPANDPETGHLYWSDYAGIVDVTTSMQVQRGLGASKVAVPSLGGTINITTRSTDVKEEGTVSQTIGNNGASKTALYYSTGLSDKGWASSILLSKAQGQMYAEGLNYSGYSYFFNLSKIISPNQTLSLTVMGATQSHGQRYSFLPIQTYRSAPQGIKYNPDWGYLNGQYVSGEANNYNKPIAMLNYNWNISDNSQFASTLYGSYGQGNATYLSNGTITAKAPTATTPLVVTSNQPRTGDPIYSPIDFNAIERANAASVNGASSAWLLANSNDHKWVGDLSTFKHKFGNNIDLLAGADLRYYTVEHYYKVADLLGGNYITDAANVNGTSNLITTGEKYNRDYRYNIASEGLFLQTEYTKDDLSAFVSVAGTNTGDKKIDYFDFKTGSAAASTKWVNFLGYQAKGGANYNLDSHNNVFANVGYLERAPLVATIFTAATGPSANQINDNSKPEKLLSYEVGYGFRSSEFTANINLYRSTYKDRSYVTSQTNPDASVTSINVTGINELHQGIEFDGVYRPIKEINIKGMLSLGDWYYTNNTGQASAQSDVAGSKVVTASALLLKGIKVGDAAQTTAYLGIDGQVLPKLKLGVDWNYYGNYNASFNYINITNANLHPWEVPNYYLFNVNAVYRFKFAGCDASLIGNVYNLLNTTYISDAYDPNASGNPNVLAGGSAGVYYGFGRTYAIGVKVKF
ncbi:TonB-dependent receptor [Mucilaginibacter sp. dw_454]|uniref:TonB-dependent receptor n=1 Tax=Mucilaginibacter sp. dw_454 TaxID=2720079 RepID=UPI001BD4E754|nr:TonB-dependent receptor [Mucilaginibacter sp. dw_454]